MSARAAWRLLSLGFTQVFRYTAGKADWAANGGPLEGTDAAIPRAGTLLRADVPTCALTERVGVVVARLPRSGGDRCVVVNEARIVLGVLLTAGLTGGETDPVEDRMHAGPSTIRPNLPVPAILDALKTRDSILVTTADGELLGLLRRPAVERALAASDPPAAEPTP